MVAFGWPIIAPRLTPRFVPRLPKLVPKLVPRLVPNEAPKLALLVRVTPVPVDPNLEVPAVLDVDVAVPELLAPLPS